VAINTNKTIAEARLVPVRVTVMRGGKEVRVNPATEFAFCGMVDSLEHRYEVLEDPRNFAHAVVLRIPYRDGDDKIPDIKMTVLIFEEVEAGWVRAMRWAMRTVTAELHEYYRRQKQEERAAKVAELAEKAGVKEHERAEKAPTRNGTAKETGKGGDPMILTLVGEIFRQERIWSRLGGRRKVNRILAEYRDADGGLYRKFFEAIGKWPELPLMGDHEHLNFRRKQW
jgi:hypothetical protein